MKISACFLAVLVSAMVLAGMGCGNNNANNNPPTTSTNGVNSTSTNLPPIQTH
jgi:hypothetical protein